MGILAFLLVGLVAGLLACALLPGRQAMGLVPTALLGMVGSLMGGLVGSLLLRHGQLFDVHPPGLVTSLLGALVLLALAGAAARREVRF